VILSAPNYIGGPSSATKAFIERLLFPYAVYASDMSSLCEKKIQAGFIYVMGSTEEWMKTMGYDWLPQFMEKVLKMIFGSSEVLVVNDIYQFDDYSKYVSSRFDPVAKAKRRDEHFYTIDCQKAFKMGVDFALSQYGTR
jgi:multimeric flavodoxin WrbA